MMFRSCHIIFYSVVALLLHSCSSVKLPITACENNSEMDFSVSEVISRAEVNRLSDERLTDLKSRLISQINTSMVSNSQLIQSVENEVSSESFSITTKMRSFGSISNPKVRFCRAGKKDVVILSIRKTVFFEKLKETLKNKIKLNQKTFDAFHENLNIKKYTFNKMKLNEFEKELIEAEYFYGVLLNYPETLVGQGDVFDYTNELGKLRVSFNEISKAINVFDKEMKLIDVFVEKKNYRAALNKVLLLERLYDPSSTEGIEVRLYKNNIYELGEKAWKTGYRVFYKSLNENKFDTARRSLNYLAMVMIDDVMASKHALLKKEYIERSVSYEKMRLLKNKRKRSELFFGVDLTGVSSGKDLNFKQKSPSFTLGLAHNFSDFPRMGAMLKYRYHTNRSFMLVNESEVPAFTQSVNEISAGVYIGFLEISYGKALSTISGINFTTISSKLSLYRSETRGLKNFIHVHAGIDLLHSFENDVNLFNLSVGLNYHLRFNRKLSRKEKRYIKSLDSI